MKIRLQGQPVEILAMLLQRPGETITREELQKKLWPADTFVDFEQGLNNAMKRLRAALDDDAESPHFIETLPRHGYRFIGSVNGSVQALTAEAGSPALQISRWVRFPWSALAASVVLAALVLWSVSRTGPLPPKIVKQKQITSNFVGNAVTSGAISPDGKYLAYVDALGMHVQSIANGDTRTVSQPESLDANAAWSIASWFPDSTSFLANATVPSGNTSIWIVSLLGRAPRKIRDDATAWSVSPDGLQIVFTAVPSLFGSREVWLMTREGEQARKLFAATDENSGFTRVAWSPDGKRVGCIRFHQVSDRFEFSIETRDLTGGPPTVLLSSLLLHDFYWLPDGRVVYSLGEGRATASDNCNLWEVRVNMVTGAPVEQPRRLTNWAGFNVDHLSATSDGKRLVFQKSTIHVNVLIGELQDGNTKLTPPQKLTLSEGFNYPGAWTSDSKAVIFVSDRNGHWGIYKQELNRDFAETLVTSDLELWGRTSPDGRWLLYFSSPDANSPSTASPTPLRLMRMPVTGGPPELVLTARLHGSAWCARSPSTLCAFAEQTPDRKELVFTAFDPVRGKGHELTRFATDPNADYNWSLSPDATRIGILKIGGNHLYVLPLDGSPVRDLTVAGWNGFNTFDWSVDSKGFFTSNTTSIRSNSAVRGSEGQATPLMATKIRLLHLGRSLSGRPAFGHFWAGFQWQHVDDREFLNASQDFCCISKTRVWSISA